MAFSLELPVDLRKAGWKVKIRDRERLEPPHVTIPLKASAWRLDLRTGQFLEPGASWRGGCLEPAILRVGLNVSQQSGG